MLMNPPIGFLNDIKSNLMLLLSATLCNESTNDISSRLMLHQIEELAVSHLLVKSV